MVRSFEEKNTPIIRLLKGSLHFKYNYIILYNYIYNYIIRDRDFRSDPSIKIRIPVVLLFSETSGTFACVPGLPE